MPENSIFGHFSPVVPSHGQPLDPTSTFIENTFITRCCCNDQQRESYSRPLPPHFPAICLKIQFLAIFDHFSQIVPTHQQSLDPTSAFIGINIMKGCCCNDIYGEKATPHYYHTIFLPENSIFDHFSPFVITQSQPLDPTSTFIGKNIIKGCCCNDIYGEKATPGYYQPIFPPLA